MNTTILGLVAERASGHTLKQLVEERITQPFGIEGLQYTKPENIQLLPSSTTTDEGLEKLTIDGKHDIRAVELMDYSPEKAIYLGGEGMLGTTDGYADFIRILLQEGEMNGRRFLDEETISEMSSPHTQLDNQWGHNGYNLWITGDTLQQLGTGEAGLWVGGGYEGTYFWIDQKRDFVGLVMTQLFNMKTSPSDVFRASVYQEIWDHE